MTRFMIHLDSDESELGIQHLTASIDGQTFGIIRDFLLGKIALTPGPLPASEAPEN